MSWEDLKEGDFLYYAARKLRTVDGVLRKDWRRTLVTKVTRAFYKVEKDGEERYRKGNEGKEFLRRYYLESDEEVPEFVDQDSQTLAFDLAAAASRKISSVGLINTRLEGLDLFVAAGFAEEYIALGQRVKKAKEEAMDAGN